MPGVTDKKPGFEILKEKVAEFESFKDNLSKIDQEINEIKSRILAKRQELKKKHKKELDKLDSILSNLSILGWVGRTLRMRLTS
jgi:predicted  nucleic acid-binding Zn-ribbon protein